MASQPLDTDRVRKVWARGLPGLALFLAVACGTSEESHTAPPANEAADTAGHAFRGMRIWEHPPGGDFKATDQHGKAFQLSKETGHIVLLFFGYAHCPDVCPTMLSTWTRVESLLGQEAEGVRFLFVTVDPERDTRPLMSRHLSAYSSRFLGITGTAEELAPIYEAYGIHHEKVSITESAAAYLIDHTSRMFLVDREGQLRLKYDFRTRPEEIASDIKWLLHH